MSERPAPKSLAPETFEEYTTLESIAQIVDADHAKVPAWRAQAKALRDLADLVDQQTASYKTHVGDASGYWVAPGTSGFQNESHQIAGSMQRSHQSMVGTAQALERIADEVEATKADMDEMRTEWSNLETQHQKNPHFFDSFAPDGTDGYQAAKEEYLRQARTRAGEMTVESVQAWHSSMYEPGDYTGPTDSRRPIEALTGDDGSGYRTPGGNDAAGVGAGGRGAGGSGGGGSPGTVTAPSGPTTAPPGSDGPDLQFTPPGTVPVGTAPVALPPAAGGPVVPPPGVTPPVVVPPVVVPPGGGPRPPVVGNLRPTATTPRGGALPSQRGSAVGRNGVLGQRPGRPLASKASLAPRVRDGVLGRRGAVIDPDGEPKRPGVRNQQKPGVPRPEKGVLRGGQGVAEKKKPAKKKRRREDKAPSGPSGELFDGLEERAVVEVVRPRVPPRIRRRDAGPAFGRAGWLIPAVEAAARAAEAAKAATVDTSKVEVPEQRVPVVPETTDELVAGINERSADERLRRVSVPEQEIQVRREDVGPALGRMPSA